MSRHLIYLIGEPGAGKSTIMAAATAHYTRIKIDKPLAHEYLLDGDEAIALELGYHRPLFSGTDTLGMSAINAAEELLATQPFPLVLAEGARLANLRFLTTATQLGYNVHLHLITSRNAPQRRINRGTTQNPSWIKGATTRANNLWQATEHLPHITRTTLNTDPPNTSTQELLNTVERTLL